MYHPVLVNVCFIHNMLVCSFAGGRWTASWELLLFVETAPLGVVKTVLDIKSVRNILSMSGTVAVGFDVVTAWLLNPVWHSVDFNQQELQEHLSKVSVCFMMHCKKIQTFPTQFSLTDYIKKFPLVQLQFLLTEFDQFWQQSVNIGSMRNNMLSQLGKKKSNKPCYWPN